ncbi:hypothetical protein FACHB389_29505 [Nostoc calcicola FACHB-389]|nr:hypothetical protein FACHB389_29505 [Nostoc calcicola FACHB-389]
MKYTGRGAQLRPYNYLYLTNLQSAVIFSSDTTPRSQEQTWCAWELGDTVGSDSQDSNNGTTVPRCESPHF